MHVLIPLIEKWYKKVFRKRPPFVIFDYCLEGEITPTIKKAIDKRIDNLLKETHCQFGNYRIGIAGRMIGEKEIQSYDKKKYETIFLLYRSTNRYSVLNLEKYFGAVKGFENTPARSENYESIKLIDGYYYLYLLV